MWDDIRRLVRGLGFRASSLFRGRRWRDDLDQEMDFHVEMEARKLAASGMSDAEARRRARAGFGARDMVQEDVRAARGVRMLDDLVRDTRQGLRQMWGAPAFSLAAVLTLALGVGATAAVVSVVHRVLLSPLPFEDPDQLAVVWQFDRLTGTQREAASVPDLADFEARNRTFDGMGAFSLTSQNLTGPGRDAQHLTVVRATHDLIPVLGLPLVEGRTFSEDEALPGGAPVTIVSQGFWQTELGGEPSAAGRTIILNDVPHQVIGVLGAEVSFPADADVWVPLQEDAITSPRFTHPITVVGRLLPGMSLEAAQADMTVIAADLEAEYSENAGRGAFVEPLSDVLHGNVRPALLALLGAAFMVLLIACVNVASLLLARGATRQREFAITRALGASTERMIRRFAVESMLLTGGALLLGCGLSVMALRVISALAPLEVQAMGPFGLDWPVLLFAISLCAFIGAAFGFLPVRQAILNDPSGGAGLGLRSESGSGAGIGARRVLVMAQMALAVTLLVQAGLLIRSLSNLQGVDPGFTEQNVLRVSYRLPESRYPRNFDVYPVWPEISGFNTALVNQVSQLPGVEAVALGTNHPMDRGFTNSFRVVGRSPEESEDQGELATRIVTSGYFETVGLPLLEGRAFTPDDDTESGLVLMLNSAAAGRYFPAGDAIGHQIAFWGGEREVIGVLADERMYGLDRAAPPAMYVPMAQQPATGAVTLMVRSAGEPQTLITPVRQQVKRLDPDVALYDISTMEETVRDATARWRFTSMLLSAFAGIALVLAAIGVFGILNYLVAQRTREIGVRMALGATPSGIRRMVLRQGAVFAGVGLGMGLLAAMLGSRLLAGLLFGVGGADPVTYLTVSLTLVVVALLACALPAFRATSVDPVRALKAD